MLHPAVMVSGQIIDHFVSAKGIIFAVIDYITGVMVAIANSRTPPPGRVRSRRRQQTASCPYR